MTGRILLVYPPSGTQSHTAPPAGPLYLASVLEHAGHEVKVVDANAINRRRSAEDIAALAREYRPDIVGMTIVTQTAREAYRLADMLKGNGTRLLAGGPHPSLVPEEPIRFGFDAVCVGEGEPVIVPAVSALLDAGPLDQVPGLVYRNGDGHICQTPPATPTEDLDAIAAPARHLIQLEDYYSNGDLERHGDIFSSRGCPYSCTYCAGGLFGRKFRHRSVEHILQEMVSVHETYGTRRFHFVDDAMTVKRDRAHAICEGIASLGLDLSWSMMTGITTVDEDLLAHAARSGCVRIDYGVESGHPDTLKKVHKPHTLAAVKDIVAATRRHGIQPVAFFIVGFPWETREHVEATLDLMKELSPSLGRFHPALASILIPFPGTEIYELYKDEFDLHEWWLRDDRMFGVPEPGRHAYYEQEFFRLGAVLDSDFFKYSADVRESILDAFSFMHHHNNAGQDPLQRSMRRLLIAASRALWRVSPSAERILFGSLQSLRNSIRSRTL